MSAPVSYAGRVLLVAVPDPLTWLPLVIPQAVATTVLTTERCLMGGWALANPGGGAGDIAHLWSAGGTAGQPLASVLLGSGGQDSATTPHPGLFCPSGIAIQASAVTIEGVIWYAPLD